MRIDLNCDLGETVDGVPTGDDAAMFPLITSASVACGFHAGDAASMREACERAAENGVVVGAHVSYLDREGFGRADVEIDAATLAAQLDEQIDALEAHASAAGVRVSYVKPHGALYNRIARDPERAALVAAVVVRRRLPLMGLPGSAIECAARDAGLRFVREAFADRGYRADGSLVPRGEPGAILAEGAVAARAVRIVTDGRVLSSDGTDVALAVDSLCVHGDSPGAVAMAASVRSALERAGVGLEAFA